MAYDFSEDQTLKPWVRNLIVLFQTWRDRTFVPWEFQALSGGERVFSDIQRVRNIVRESVIPRPSVYYVGIGNIGALNIDLIYPLLTTDFSELIAVDIGPRERALFSKFLQAVTLNLSLIDEINQKEIHFRMLGEDNFVATFVYDGTARNVQLRTNFDATTAYPEELQNGYDVLFTRRTNALFSSRFINCIPEEMRDKILDFLAPHGLAIFQEIVGDLGDMHLRIDELRQWLGSDFSPRFASRSNEADCDKIMCFARKADAG